MESLVNFLPSGETVLLIAQVAAAFVTAIATFALWRVTGVLAIETKILAKNSSQSFVVCSIVSSKSSAHAMNVVIQNSGNAAAFDIEVICTPGLPNPNEKHDQRLDLWASKFSVSMLPPGNSLIPNSVMGNEIYDKEFVIQCSWASFPNSRERQHLKYSFKASDGFKAGWSEKGAHQIANTLEKIEKAISSRR